MKLSVNLDDTGLDRSSIEALRSTAEHHLQDLWSETERGSEGRPVGWLEYPNIITEEEISRIEAIASDIRKNNDALVVLGVGGSYLGSKALIDLTPGDSTTEVVFAGYGFTSRYFREVIDSLKEKAFSICVVSKSGGTMETLASLAILSDVLVKRYGESVAATKTFIVTGSQDSPLRRYGEEIGATIIDIPVNIGGRFSVLTAVGLLPAAVHGINIRGLIRGAKNVAKREAFFDGGLDYAICRNLFWSQGKTVEVFESFDSHADFFGLWLQQLFGESEGKEGKGIYPTTLTFSRDLHSMGQFLQEGNPVFFETVLLFDRQGEDMVIPENSVSPELSHISVSSVCKAIENGVMEAHRKSRIPLIAITINELTAERIGELFYYFMVQCAVSACLLGVNPFGQPGVEKYKREVRETLKGHEMYRKDK